MNEAIKINGPVDDFRKVLFEATIDTDIDLLELSIDYYLKDGKLKDFPMVGAFYSFGKAIIGVKDLILTKKVLIFSQKVQNKLVSDFEMKQHLEELSNNPKKLHKELEIIITYLNRHTKYTKSLMLANFYILYLGREIEWEDFDFFAEIIDGISVYDLKVLKIIWEKKIVKEGEKYNPISLQRLRNHGLIEYHDGVTVQKKSVGLPYIASINEIGMFFCDYGMNGVWDVVMKHNIIA